MKVIGSGPARVSQFIPTPIGVQESPTTITLQSTTSTNSWETTAAGTIYHQHAWRNSFAKFPSPIKVIDIDIA